MTDTTGPHDNDQPTPNPPARFRRADVAAPEHASTSDAAQQPRVDEVDGEAVEAAPVEPATETSEAGDSEAVDTTDAQDLSTKDGDAGGEEGDAERSGAPTEEPLSAFDVESSLLEMAAGTVPDVSDVPEAIDAVHEPAVPIDTDEAEAGAEASDVSTGDAAAAAPAVDEPDEDDAAVDAEFGAELPSTPEAAADAEGEDEDAADNVSAADATTEDVAASDPLESEEAPAASIDGAERRDDVEAEAQSVASEHASADDGAMSSASELESYLADELGAMSRECDRLREAVETNDTATAGALGNELAVATGRLAMFFGQDRLAEVGAAMQTAARGAAPHIEGDAARGVSKRLAMLGALLGSAAHVAMLGQWNLAIFRERIEACVGGSCPADADCSLDDLAELCGHDQVLAGAQGIEFPVESDAAAVDAVGESSAEDVDGDSPASVDAAAEVSPPAESLDLPDQPTSPATPAAPADPTSPSAPTVLDMSDMPAMPTAPEAPGMPDMPDMPGAPGMPDDVDDWGSAPLMLAPADIEKLLAAIPRVRGIAEEIEPILNDASDFTGRAEASPKLVASGENISLIADDFNLSTLRELGEFVALTGAKLEGVGSRADDVPDALLPELFLRLRTIAELLDQYCAALEVGMELKWPLSTMRRRIELMLAGKFLHPELVEWHRGDVERVIELDGITEGVEPLPTPPSEVGDGPAANAVVAVAKSAAEETIRMSRGRLEELLDLVRQLVLNKNQVHSLAERARVDALDGLAGEQLGTRAAEYARLVGRLQESLSAARFQPIGLALERFERPVRDVAQLNDREANLSISGGSTGIDKFVLDAIAEPIGRVLRFVAGHHIEPTAVRESVGKNASGSVHVAAIDLGTHILIRIEDDGAGATDESLRERARAFDQVDHDELAAMSSEALALLAFEPWHADSDVAGVADQVRAAGGSMRVVHTEGRGTTIEVLSPIRGAVIDAMRVEVGGEIYAVPVRAVVRIVRERDVDVHTIGQQAAARISGGVVPVVDCYASLGAVGASSDPALVVVAVDGRSVALRVDKVLGDQEVVIDQTGLAEDEQGPFLGATIEDDGRVAFVIDVDRLSRMQHDDGAGHSGSSQGDDGAEVSFESQSHHVNAA